MDEQRDLVVVGTRDGCGFPGHTADRRQPGEQRTEYRTEALFDTGRQLAPIADAMLTSATWTGAKP